MRDDIEDSRFVTKESDFFNLCVQLMISVINVCDNTAFMIILFENWKKMFQTSDFIIRGWISVVKSCYNTIGFLFQNGICG